MDGNSKDPVAVIGVGASAGGLDALKAFLGAGKPPVNAAVIIVQHLAPKHESMMAELLNKVCAFDVIEAY